MSPSNPAVRRLYRSVGDRMIAGIAGGLAEYLKVDAVWIRILFVALAFLSGGVFLLVYLAAWILVPESSEPGVTPVKPPSRLHRSKADRMVGGVCGGLAETFKVDPTLVRLAAVAAIVFTGGAALLGYVVAWAVMPLDAPSEPPALPAASEAEVDVDASETKIS
jgi:phage shock protein PspC (stress-responsive transcriptional regulator)